MKKFFIALTLSLFITPLFAQATDQAGGKSNPVQNTFGTTTLIDMATTESPFKHSLELQIQHRFSVIDNIHDLYGIYGSANTRISLHYGITDRLSIGVGTTKDYKLQDISWKYKILQQTEDNSMPVSLAYYGNIVADLRTEDNFAPPTSKFKQIHRLSFLTQLILARKFSEKISAEIAPSLSYFNTVTRYDDTHGYKNLNLGISAGARANLFGNNSLVLEYDQLLTKQDLATQPKPNLAAGWEIGTGTHSFQIFVANYNQIIYQRNLVYNDNGKYLIGFNIHVRF